MILYKKNGWKIVKGRHLPELLMLYKGETLIDYISPLSLSPQRRVRQPEEVSDLWYFFWAMKQ